MRNFLLIGSGVQVIPLVNALYRKPYLWNQNLLRTTHPLTPHTEVDDIWLRFNPLPEAGQEAQILDEHESMDYPAYAELPEARALIMPIMAAVGGTRLGRCLITRLPPGKNITPHVDGGSHAAYYERYHVCLQSVSGTLFRCGDEQVAMSPGEVWWFQNQLEHEVMNHSPIDRLHLIIDIKQ